MNNLTWALLRTYSVANRIGLLELPICRRLFVKTYFLYKRFFEDAFQALTKNRPTLFTSGHVLDIGANIGYTALVFSKAVEPGFKIFAFEPEEANFAMLTRQVSKLGLDNLQPIRAAVGNKDGVIKLWKNRSHHADHRVVTAKYQDSGIASSDCVSVKQICLDNFLESEGIRNKISFIKIDVQGYELPVLEGLRQTISENPNLSIAFEYAPVDLQKLGYQPEDLLSFFAELGFQLYLIEGGGLSPLDAEATERLIQQREYTDLLASRQAIRF